MSFASGVKVADGGVNPQIVKLGRIWQVVVGVAMHHTRKGKFNSIRTKAQSMELEQAIMKIRYDNIR